MRKPRRPLAPQMSNLIEEPVPNAVRAATCGPSSPSPGDGDQRWHRHPFHNVYLFTFGDGAGCRLRLCPGGLLAAIAGLFAPALARRAGSLRAVFLVRILPVPFFILLLLAPGFAVAAVAHLVRAVLTSMNWPVDSTFTAEVLPRRMTATVFGLRSASWNFGWAAASFVGGWLIVRGGYEWPSAGLIVFAIASALSYQLYFGRHPRVRTGAILSALTPAQRTRLTVASLQVTPPMPTPRLDEVPAP